MLSSSGTVDFIASRGLVIMREQLVGVLPFISFREEIIKLDGVLVFSDSRVYDITELGRSAQETLAGFAQTQKAFIWDSYGNQESEITFLLPTEPNMARKQLEYFVEILFFYLHKGGHLTYLLSTPNVFCREDFRLFVLKLLDADNPGGFLAKTKFKFHIAERADQYVIYPDGCENVVTQNQQHGYVFRDVELNHQDEAFQFLMQSLGDPKRSHVLQGISFYNRAMSCELTDAERFVWLSSSLESFLQIGKQNDKGKAIREEVQNLLQHKAFRVVDKGETISNVADLITVIYDYRSSYVHGGEMLTEHPDLEARLIQKLGKLDFVVALMNLVSFLLVHEKIPDNKLEGVLHALFCNQECFECVLGIYKDSADKAISELQNRGNVLAAYRFLFTSDLQAIRFERRGIVKCMDNILRILAKFAGENQGRSLSKKVQQQIDAVAFSDRDKFEKWDGFLRNIDASYAPEPVYVSILVFRQLFRLLRYEYALY
jgi:hypothetical protein